jgi:hypothetical protein
MSSFDSYGRYVYGHFRSEEIAEKALEDMFASGEVSEGEFPRWSKKGDSWDYPGRWIVTLKGE